MSLLLTKMFGRRRFSSFRKLTQMLKHIEQEKSSLSKKSILSQYLKGIEKSDIQHLIKLIQYSSKSFASISEGIICKVLITRNFISEQELSNALIKQKKTLSEIVIQVYNKRQSPIESKEVELEKIVSTMQEIQQMKGKGSQPQKLDKLNELFEMCSKTDEIEYIVRILLRNLRLGMTEKSILPLLEQHSEAKPSQKTNGNLYLPMLARPLRALEDATKFAQNSRGRIAVQIKYDGQRTNIYYNRQNDSLRLVSRNGKEQSDSFPDLYQTIKEQIRNQSDLKTAVFDAEIVAVQKTSNKPLPIQVLISRKGKSRERMSQDYTENIMLFDIVEKDGQSLIDLPYIERIQKIPKFGRESLCMVIQPKFFQLPEEIEQLKTHFKKVLKQGYEGIMLKNCDSRYDVKGGRKDWAKLKKGCRIDNEAYQAIELDLVLMGVEQGRGKRKNFFGSYLFGAPHQGRIVPVCRVGTGVTEDELTQLTAEAKNLIVSEKPEEYDIPATLSVDYWVRPEIIYEISCQDLTRSPLYKLSQQSGRGGISMRFPIFVRRRTDKSLKEATNGQQILQLCKSLEIN